MPLYHLKEEKNLIGERLQKPFFCLFMSIYNPRGSRGELYLIIILILISGHQRQTIVNLDRYFQAKVGRFIEYSRFLLVGTLLDTTTTTYQYQGSCTFCRYTASPFFAPLFHLYILQFFPSLRSLVQVYCRSRLLVCLRT